MKKLKGFTLIELIIVMAILTILMVAIMQMFKPIRSTYVDATLYENQRASQNGMIQYITESVRYATDLGLYTTDKASSVTAAVDEFADAYITANNIVDITGGAQNATNAKEAIQRYAEVIIIDNTTSYTFNNVNGWKGRILRRKFVDETPGAAYKYKKITNNAEKYTETEECRMALGASYYGDKNYTISFKCGDPAKTPSPTNPWKADDGIMITVASFSKRGLEALNEDDGSNNTAGLISTTGEVMCKNLAGASNHGVSKSGIFDIANFTAGSSTGSGTKVYIVYLNPGEDGIEAVRTAAGL